MGFLHFLYNEISLHLGHTLQMYSSDIFPKEDLHKELKLYPDEYQIFYGTNTSFFLLM